MILELTGGRILHTAYSNNNLGDPEGFSLDSQDGATYKGTYIDESTTESTNPEDYSWEELFNPDIDDTDNEGEYGPLTIEAELSALQSQINALQDRAQELAENVTQNFSGAALAAGVASEAQNIANATRQHFWTDDNGAHVTEVTQEDWNNEESPNYQSGANSLWNSLGMLFRKGLTNLLAILSGGVDGTDPKGLAIYDGAGNAGDNIVAMFTDSGALIGKANNGQLKLESDTLTLLDKKNNPAFIVHNETSTTPTSVSDNVLGDLSYPLIGTISHTLKNEYLGDLKAEIIFEKYEVVGSVVLVKGQAVLEINLSNFGSWTVSSQYGEAFSASGTIVFDSTSNTVVLTVDTASATDWVINGYWLSYSGYAQAATVCVANPDLTNVQNYVALIGDGLGGNAITIDRNGNLDSLRKIYAELGYYINLNGQKRKISRHVVERGTTSNSWDYVLYDDNTYEAWRTHHFESMTLTTASMGTYYGSSGSKTLSVPLFPNNQNITVTQAFAQERAFGSHSSGVYVYQIAHETTGPNAEMTIQFRAHASTTNGACGVDLYIKGEYV